MEINKVGVEVRSTNIRKLRDSRKYIDRQDRQVGPQKTLQVNDTEPSKIPSERPRV